MSYTQAMAPLDAPDNGEEFEAADEGEAPVSNWHEYADRYQRAFCRRGIFQGEAGWYVYLPYGAKRFRRSLAGCRTVAREFGCTICV